LPLGKRLREGILYDVLGQVDILGGEDPGQNGDQLPRFVPEKMVDKLMDGRLVDGGYFPPNLRNAAQRAHSDLISEFTDSSF